MTPRDRLAVLAAQLGERPGLRDGPAALRWQIAVVRAVMQAPPDGDAVRELYGELVDRYRERPARLAALRSLGDEIRQREEDGTLARALVARSERHGRRVARGTAAPAGPPPRHTRGTPPRPRRR